MGRKLDRLVHPLGRGENDPADRARMAPHRRHGEMGAVGDRPEIDLARAERLSQILEIVGILLGRIALHRDPGRPPCGDALFERLAMIGAEHILGQRHCGIELPSGAARLDMVGEAGAPLVVDDDVGDGAQGKEDGLARAPRGPGAGAARSAGEIDDWRAGPGRSRLETQEADLDPARARIVAVLGNGEAAALGRDLAAVGKLERGRLERQPGRRGGESGCGEGAKHQCKGAKHFILRDYVAPELKGGGSAFQRRSANGARLR